VLKSIVYMEFLAELCILLLLYINMWMLSTRISQPLSNQQYDTAFGVLCILFTIATPLTLLWLAAVTSAAETEGVSSRDLSRKDVLHFMRKRISSLSGKASGKIRHLVRKVTGSSRGAGTVNKAGKTGKTGARDTADKADGTKHTPDPVFLQSAPDPVARDVKANEPDPDLLAAKVNDDLETNRAQIPRGGPCAGLTSLTAGLRQMT
jgi:hypothetical protein